MQSEAFCALFAVSGVPFYRARHSAVRTGVGSAGCIPIIGGVSVCLSGCGNVKVQSTGYNATYTE